MGVKACWVTVKGLAATLRVLKVPPLALVALTPETRARSELHQRDWEPATVPGTAARRRSPLPPTRYADSVAGT